jgi:hypothetical protein
MATTFKTSRQMRRPFKKNYHLARPQSLEKVEKLIADYPKQFSPAKYLLFMGQMLKAGWKVRLYKAGISKYVFIEKGDDLFKVRFSNHKPIYFREIENDCDFYVGVSHTQVSTTEQIISKLMTR